MNLPLYQSWSFESHLPARAIAAALREVTEEGKLVPIRKPFIGRVADEAFTITKVIDYGNPFHPRLRGELVDCEAGTTVRVRVYPSTFSLLICMPGVIVFNLLFITAILHGMFSVALFVGLVFLPFTVFSFGGFASESAKSKSLLQNLIDHANVLSKAE